MEPLMHGPIMRYHGGKWRIAEWVISHFPKADQYDTYIEPFGGAGSVLMQKAPSQFEVYNDLDSEIVNVFRVLRDPLQADRLMDLLMLTPYAREEFELTYREVVSDPVEQARRTLFRAASGFGSASATKGRTGFRGYSGSSGRGVNPARYWSRYPPEIAKFCERLKTVVIENRPAVQLMRDRDGPRVLHYADPPYVLDSRVMQTGDRYYRHEMTDDDHADLISTCAQLEGFVILSGYQTDVYRDLLSDWKMVSVHALASGNRGSVKRTECLWLSPRVASQQYQNDMFNTA